MIYSEKIQRAVQFASHKHKDQKRKILDYPYITHPLMVFYLVSKFSDDEDVLCAAILHDTVEDTDSTLDEIEGVFGETVRYFVDILSDDKSLEKKERKEKYYKRLIEENNRDITLIKSADILYNLTDFIQTIEYGGKDKFLTMFSNFERYNSMLKNLIIEFEKIWPKNPFLSDIHFYLNKLDALIKHGILDKEISCGIIPVYINEQGEKEFLIIRENAGHWSFPKGHIDVGENYLQTAQRELLEETGLVCSNINKENVILEKFINQSRTPATEKTVYYHIGYVDTKEITIQLEEIQDYFWGNYNDVLEKLTHQTTKNLFKESIKFI